MDDRALHIIAVTVGLALFGAAYALAPIIHGSWRPASAAGLAAHAALGWIGRHFWYGWALLAGAAFFTVLFGGV